MDLSFAFYDLKKQQLDNVMNAKFESDAKTYKASSLVKFQRQIEKEIETLDIARAKVKNHIFKNLLYFIQHLGIENQFFIGGYEKGEYNILSKKANNVFDSNEVGPDYISELDGYGTIQYLVFKDKQGKTIRKISLGYTKF